MRAAIVAAAGLSACAVQLQTPEPDLPDRTPMKPAPLLSQLTAVARIPHATLGKIADAQTQQPLGGQESIGVLQASWKVAREGQVAVSSDDRSRLCFVSHFAGKAEATALGQRIDRDFRAKLSACARPELDAGAVLHLRDPDAKVLIDRSAIGGPIALVLDAIVGKLQAAAGEAALKQLREMAVPTWDALKPLQTSLQTPIDVGGKGCVKLRPQSVKLTQPMIEPSGLRMGASIAAMPTAEMPCVREDLGAAARLPASVVDSFETDKTMMLLPVAVSLDLLKKPVEDELARLGVMKTAQGWFKVTGVRLATAKGQLLVFAGIEGQLQDKVLFVPFQRAIKGEVLLWGTPEVTREGVVLRDVNLELHTDDRMVALGAELKHSQLVDTVRKYARLPKDRIDAMAKQALDDFSNGIRLGGEKLPARIAVDQLAVESVAAAGQRLEVAVRFVGQVVIGDTAVR